MPTASPPPSPALDPAVGALAHETVALVRDWLRRAADVPAEPAATRLAALLRDPGGLDFAVGFIDTVIRPEDPKVAASNLAALSRDLPQFLGPGLRAAMRLGGWTAVRFPALVMPVVRRVLRRMVAHLLVDARTATLGRAIGHLRKPDVRLNINVLGEAVLGEREAARRLEATTSILARPDVDYVSIKVSATVAPHSPWAFDEAVHHIVERLQPLYQLAKDAPVSKFINLDMEEYRDLDLTLAVFMQILDMPELLELQAGIVLQAYLPDALGAMMRIQAWAADRRERGGAPVKVRLVKGANLPMERVEASLHGWPLATWSSKQETDTNYKRVLDYALHPDRLANVRIGVAGHNLFDLAYAWLLADRRSARDGMDVEMLLGMASAQAEIVKRDVGSLILYTPVVHPREFDVAIAYLIRRLEEGASSENFLSAVFDLHSDDTLFERERLRFLTSLRALDDRVPEPNRQQNRETRTSATAGSHDPPQGDRDFRNAPDTDPALPANRTWARHILTRARDSQLGQSTVTSNRVETVTALDRVLGEAHRCGREWGLRSGHERADTLDRVAHSLELHRAALIEVMVAEAGKTLDQADPEVSEAIDFAAYYAHLARELDDVDGASFRPVALTVVTPPWNFPVAIPAGSMLAALAAGSAVILKPSPQVESCAAVLVEALWEAGVPRGVLSFAPLDEHQLGRRLIADPRVDRVILTGGWDTAELFMSFRHDLPLMAETSGKNAIVVTPSADLDLAVKDIVASAFGHAGQKCSATSLTILVGSVATSRRFREQLLDAVTSLTVGPAFDPTTRMGPLIEAAQGKLLKGLTELGAGESWLVQPKQLDETGLLWSPGVRQGVVAGSRFHQVEYFGPVLGLMTAVDLDEAVTLQNGVDYGLTAGLHSLDAAEISQWLSRVQAGNLYVNRGTTGAIVRRQPFGGWKRSTVGTGTKAGGPNYLISLGDWASATSTESDGALQRSVGALLAAAAASAGDCDGDRLRRAFGNDATAWRHIFARTGDVSALLAERNLLRYVPVPVTIRHTGGPALTDLVRTVGAGLLCSSSLTISTPDALPEPIASVLHDCGATRLVQDEREWLAGIALNGVARVRLVGARDSVRAAGSALAEAVESRAAVAVFSQPVTESGRVELLTFLREQAISITAHRFGTPDHLTDGLI